MVGLRERTGQFGIRLAGKAGRVADYVLSGIAHDVPEFRLEDVGTGGEDRRVLGGGQSQIIGLPQHEEQIGAGEAGHDQVWLGIGALELQKLWREIANGALGGERGDVRSGVLQVLGEHVDDAETPVGILGDDRDVLEPGFLHPVRRDRIDQRVGDGDAEDFRNAGGGDRVRPAFAGNERYLVLFGDRTNGGTDGAVRAAGHGHDALARCQAFKRGDTLFRNARRVLDNKLDLLAKKATVRVDLLDGNGHAVAQGFPGLDTAGRRERRNAADLDGLLSRGRGRAERKGYEGCG